MSIELIQAAQQALSALEKSQPHPSNPVIGLTNQDFIDHEDTIRQLRTAIQQAEAPQPATGETDDVVRVPMQILKDASEALGNFVSDHGWGDADMQAMDNLDAYIARHAANRAAVLTAKDASA